VLDTGESLHADHIVLAASPAAAANLIAVLEPSLAKTWDDARAVGAKRVGLEHLHVTLRRLLAEQAVFFEATWQRLTLPQRAALRALVLEDGLGLLGADVRARYRLGGASSVQAALAALQRQDVVTREDDRWVVVDSLMREWIARRTY